MPFEQADDPKRSSCSDEFWLTFGRSKTERNWNNKRSLTFAELAELVADAPVGGKDGTCYTPAVFRGKFRRMDDADRIDVVVLDADCGHTMQEIEAAVRAQGWRAIIHSTYSHLTDQTILAADAAEKWLAEDNGRTIAGYMASKRGYLPRVIQNATIVDDTTDENGRRNLVVRHYPCPKFRVLLPLAEPWMAENYANQPLANAAWRERIGALSAALKLHSDQSCVDTSRLFYLPRRRSAEQVFEYRVVDTDLIDRLSDCDLWSIPEAPTGGVSLPGEDAPLPLMRGLRAVGGTAWTPAGQKEFTDPTTGEVVDLVSWAAAYGLRFEAVTALKARAPHVFATKRGVAGVKHHIWCPNESDHVTGVGDGSGTYAVNASQMAAAGLPQITSGFVIHCNHGGCKAKPNDRLDHIRAFLERGDLSIADLTDEQFLAEEVPVGIDFAAVIESARRDDGGSGEAVSVDSLQRVKAASEDSTSGNIHPSLYASLPGALGAMHKWIMATSPKPQPALTLGACLAFAAAAIGQKVKLEYSGLRPNVYIMSVAYSGAGKERPHSACKQMAKSAGLTHKLIGVEEITSDAGIVNSVARAPHQLMLVDEASFIIAAANSGAAGQHVKGVVSTLLKLYSSSATEYKSKSYAEETKIKVIASPCVSFYGTTTPAGLTDALSTKDITSGLLSRLVLFDAGEYDPIGSMPSQEGVPSEVTDWLLAWDRVSAIPNPLAREGGEAVMEPRTVHVTEEAMAAQDAFRTEMHEAKLAARERGKDALYVRAWENAMKFALIRACAAVLPVQGAMGPAIDESALRVDGACMRWAIDLSRATVRRMDSATNEIADTGFGQQLKALAGIVRQAGANGVTLRDVARSPAGKHPKRVIDEMFQNLTQSGEVFWVRMKTGGRDRAAWVHKSHVSGHDVKMQGED